MAWAITIRTRAYSGNGTLYYVGAGGNDASAGTSWATRWLTLTKAAQTLTAGDGVVIGAEEYNETFGPMTNAGTAVDPIIAIGDPDGEITGAVGTPMIDGESTRLSCIQADAGDDWWQFHHLKYGWGTSYEANMTGADNLLADCIAASYNKKPFQSNNASGTTTLRRCIFLNGGSFGLYHNAVGELVVDNCMLRAYAYPLYSMGTGNVTITNVTISIAYRAFYLIATTGTPVVTIRNTLIDDTNWVLSNGSAGGSFDFNYNLTHYSDSLWDGTPESTGANNIDTKLPRIDALSGEILADSPAVDAGTGSGAPSDDILGVARGATPDIGCYEYVEPDSGGGNQTAGGTWAV